MMFEPTITNVALLYMAASYFAGFCLGFRPERQAS